MPPMQDKHSGALLFSGLYSEQIIYNGTSFMLIRTASFPSTAQTINLSTHSGVMISGS